MCKGSPCQPAANKQRCDINVKMDAIKVKMEGWAGRHREREGTSGSARLAATGATLQQI